MTLFLGGGAARVNQIASKVKIGKDPLPSTLFKFLSTALLLDLSRESIFARTFMILAWNLMSRSKNTFNVHLNHMEWKEDSLQNFSRK